MSQPSSFSAYGAVDLSALARRAPTTSQPAAAAPPAPAGGSASGDVGGQLVVDIDEAGFSALLELSTRVPVILDFWAEWCGPCKQLSPVLERLAVDYAGQFVLAKVDVDANQRLGAAFQVQSIPSVFALIGGQPAPLFQGALPEAQVRQYLDEVLRVAAENGVAVRVEPTGAPSPGSDAESAAAPPVDPRYDEAYDAIERGDFDAAAAAYRALLDQTPGDADARAGLAQVELLRRTSAVDERAVRAAGAQRPDDVAAQTAVADLDLLGGHVDDAFRRLIDTIRISTGPDREAARAHLLDLFEIVGTADPRVVAARRALASALF